MSNINLSNFETGDSSFQDLYVYGKLNCNSVNDVQISVNGSTLTFTVVGVGSTTLILSWHNWCYSIRI